METVGHKPVGGEGFCSESHRRDLELTEMVLDIKELTNP